MVLGQTLVEMKEERIAKKEAVTKQCTEIKKVIYATLQSTEQTDLFLGPMRSAVNFADKLFVSVTYSCVNAYEAMIKLQENWDRTSKKLIIRMERESINKFVNLLYNCARFYLVILALLEKMVEFDLSMVKSFEELRSDQQTGDIAHQNMRSQIIIGRIYSYYDI